MLPLLSRLVDESARPLAAVERNFAADATGFSSQVYARWFDYKHGGERRYQKWVKLQPNTGVLTHVITAAVVTEGTQNDSPVLPELVERTAANFDMREQSADKGYLSHANLAAIERVGARPFVPFKSNSGSTGSEAWERMFHYFALNRESFLVHYHRRSNVESGLLQHEAQVWRWRPQQDAHRAVRGGLPKVPLPQLEHAHDGDP
jgi:transposase